MGSFYTNVLVREPNIDIVTGLLAARGSAAYIAGDGAVTVVYDERAERNPAAELDALAIMLSAKLHRPSLAISNYGDDVLEYRLAENGKIIDWYNSYPGFSRKAGRDRPDGGDAHRL